MVLVRSWPDIKAPLSLTVATVVGAMKERVAVVQSLFMDE